MDNYNTELINARATSNFKKPLGNIVRHDIPELLSVNLNKSIYSVKGSVGAGRWTDVPWISVFDTRITQSAQKGVFIVYLLNKNTKELFLTLNQGATSVAQASDSSEMSQSSFAAIAKTASSRTTIYLQNEANRIRELINCNLPYGNDIHTGSVAYDAGCIFYKKYELGTLPDDEVLYDDLNLFITAYNEYYNDVFLQLIANNDSLSSFNTNDWILAEKDETDTMTIKEQLNSIRAYVTCQGFSYPNNLIENFYLSLKSKPFVILAGISGTGKTRLVKLFAEAIGATKENGQYELIPVRPDWSDSSDLLGHMNLNGEFVEGALNGIISRATKNTDKPYFLCLDEMNLARVEYYFSDFLSIIETRKWADESITTDSNKSAEKRIITTDSIKLANDDSIVIPENLYVIGTVNMDDTTFPFSKKVLDRANTIEFNDVDLLYKVRDDNNIDAINIGNSFLKSQYLTLSECKGDDDLISDICKKLQDINEILKKANLHVGYRVRDEIVFYLLNNKNADNLIDFNSAFDNQLMQKILPRIQGSSESIRKMMFELFKVFNGGCSVNYDESTAEKIESSYINNVNNKKCIYPASAKKIQMMMQRFDEDGFTSYWV